MMEWKCMENFGWETAWKAPTWKTEKEVGG